MIHVTFLTHSLRVGGAEVQLTALATGLDRQVFSPTVVSFYDDGDLLDQIRQADIPVITLGKRRRGEALGFLLRIAKALRETTPDIVYSYLDFPNVAAALCKPWRPEWRLVWGMRASDMRLAQRDFIWRAMFSLERLLARRADAIICNSRAGQEHLALAGFVTDQMIVLPNGIDTDRFRPDRQTRIRGRHELGLEESDVAIILVARLDPMKDHENFLQAVAELGQSLPRVRFFCAGGGEAGYAQHLKTLARRLGVEHRVSWLGPRSDVGDLLKACDIATLTSAYGEGFPNIVGEAMASGLPCVVTDVGDAADVVGDTGLVVPTAAPRELAAAWKTLAHSASDELQAAGRKARARIVDEFPRQAMIDRSAQCLQRVFQAKS